MDDETKKLIERMQAEIDGLKNPRKPEPLPNSFGSSTVDYTAGASPDPETMRELARAVPGNIVQDIRRTLFPKQPVASAEPAKRVEKGSGWSEPTKLGPPAGIEHVDRLVDAADAQERMERVRKIVEMVRGQRGLPDDAA